MRYLLVPSPIARRAPRSRTLGVLAAIFALNAAAQTQTPGTLPNVPAQGDPLQTTKPATPAEIIGPPLTPPASGRSPLQPSRPGAPSMTPPATSQDPPSRSRTRQPAASAARAASAANAASAAPRAASAASAARVAKR
jgi:hypothetical protein